MHRLIAPTLLVIFFLCAITAATFGMGEAHGGPVTGGEAPDLKLTDMNGSPVSLSDLKGKAVLLNFWATYCDPCVAEMPSIQKLYDELRAEGLVVLAVSLDKSAAPVRGFIRKEKYSFTVLLDPGKKAARIYRVSMLPTTFIIGRDGSIRYRVVGQDDWTKTENIRKIKEVLK